MAASRFLAAAAGHVIVLSFAAGSRKSWLHQGCDGDLATFFFVMLALAIFLSKFLSKGASKLSLFGFGAEIRFWSCNFRC